MLRRLTLILLSMFAAIPAIAHVETAPSLTPIDHEIAFTRADVAGEISFPAIELFEPETRLTLFPSNRKLASGSSTSLAETNYLEPQELSAESWQGHDYMHARYYSPVMGRFLSVDPAGYFPQLPQAWNRYSYALNNPVNNTDPDGRCVAALPCPGWLATGTRTVATQVGSRAAAGSAAGPVGVAVASVGITGWQLGRGIGTVTIGGRTIDSRVEDVFVSMMDNTQHGDDRANDPDREVDRDKVKAHGDRYIDAEEGTTVYVHGGSVVIENEAGQLVTQWNDQTKQETRKKEKQSKWRRVPRDQDEPELE